MIKLHYAIFSAFFIFASFLSLHLTGTIDNYFLNKRIELINGRDREDIELLFRQLLFEEQFGYTLFGEKPISLAGYFTEQPEGNIVWGHSERIPFGRLWKTWSKYQHAFEGKNFILLNEPDLSSDKMRVITLINKKQLVAKADENRVCCTTL